MDLATGVALEPEHDCDRRDGRFFATRDEPWLRLRVPALETLAGRYVEIVYRSSLWDEPVRPVFRIWQLGGSFVDHLGAGPIAGAGVWTGRLPQDVTGISVSPTLRPGPFDFVVETLRGRPWAALIADGLARNRTSTRSAILTRLIGWGPESDNNLAWAIGANPIAGFPSWSAKRVRPLALEGLDRPRFRWTEAAPIRIVVRADAAAAGATRKTCESLAAQAFPHWTALIVGGERPFADERLAVATRTEAVAALGDLAPGSVVGVVPAGAALFPSALATLAEQARRDPRRRLLYGDALVRGADGAPQPLLLPGWSPRLQRLRPFLRAPVFVRATSTSTPADWTPADWTPAERTAYLLDDRLPDAFLAGLAADEVLPLRRVLVELTEPLASPPLAAPAIVPKRRATASVIIPTRDHPALLRRAIASIRRSGERCRIVVADNDSSSEDGRTLLASLRAESDVLVTDHPGPFNFSRICNDAAAAAPADVLVFLNDDTEIISADWLDRLCMHATDRATGAVGAKLTYPDGRLQHVGVLLGMGGSAGHFGALAPGDDPGWAERNLAAHEVSAVTGACLAVAREKFEAVGGFDAEHLPIELSDIDLCLKLNARGWQTIVDPAVHIMHEESASRGGATLRRLAVHDAERAVFLDRWRRVLRDDPTFHPGLSLYSWRAALG